MKPTSTDTQQIERDIDAGQGEPATNPEQAADLAALTAGAAENDPPEPGAGPAPGPAIPQPSAASLQLAAMLLGVARPILCYVVKPLASAPAELWEPLPVGVAGVLDHLNLSESELMRNPWARLGLSALPLAGYAVMHYEAEPKPAEPERIAGPDLSATAPVEPAGPKTVTFGAPVEAR